MVISWDVSVDIRRSAAKRELQISLELGHAAAGLSSFETPLRGSSG
jgi:hypothetical protein